MAVLSAYLALQFVFPPYRKIIHNVGPIFSVALPMYFLIWYKVRDSFSQYRTAENELLTMLLLVVMMLVTIIIAIVRIVKVVVSIYKFCNRK